MNAGAEVGGGVNGNPEMQALLRMASQSASRERRIISEVNVTTDVTPQSPANKTRRDIKKLEDSCSDRKVFKT